MSFTKRNIAIDLLRASTMFLMIFVNDLWTIREYPEWLGHAEWGQDMLGLADIVFPAFLFAVGMSIPYAIENRFSKGLSGVSTVGHILTRTLALLIMGVFIVNTESGVSRETGMSYAVYRILMVVGFILIWNLYPKTEKKQIKQLYSVLKILGLILLLYLAIVFRDNDGGIFQARWWGILGAIGWAYLICAFVYIFSRDRLKYLIPVWIILVLICIFQTGMHDGSRILNLPGRNFFNEMLSILHVGNGALPAFTMGGILLSVISTKHLTSGKQRLVFYTVAVIVLLLAGFISHKYWIISKLQATPTWIFYCTAISTGSYGILYWLAEKGKAKWFDIIKPAGTATLTCYLVPYLAYSAFSLVGFHLPDSLTTGFVGIIKCILFSLLVIGITYLLGKINIKLKI